MIAIVKYNAGNIRSVQNALDRLGYDSIITDNPEELRSAEKVIFPGVGEAQSAMNYLQKRGLDKVITQLQQPVLGICLGLQLLCRHSEEGDVQCLGVFENDVKLFPAEDIVPHMGWNHFQKIDGKLFKGLEPTDNVYFVHSYYATLSPSTGSVCDYILPFSASLEKDNFYAAQFHPEKSGTVGSNILKNFLEL